MSSNVLTNFPPHPKCVVCGKLISEGPAVLCLTTEIYTIKEVDLEDDTTAIGDIAADLDWTDQHLAHVECLKEAHQ